MILFELFLSFLEVGLFSFGGGMAALPLIQDQVVTKHGWLSMAEFSDLVTIAEMTPGPICINAATFVGTKVAGIVGSLIATIGSILPACIIVAIFTYIYFKYKGLKMVDGVLAGLRPAVVALISSAALSLVILCMWGEGGFVPALSAINPVGAIMFFCALFVLRKFKPSPILVMMICGAIGGIIYTIM